MRFGVLRKRISLGCCLLLLTACTVVDLDDSGKPIIPTDPSATPSYSSQTPETIADELWQSKMVPLAQQQALDWPALKQQQQQESSHGKSFFTRFHGVVTEFDNSTREGWLKVDVQGESVQVQVGPMVKGNALRDAASFIRFEDFKNQVQFAQLAKALNKKAVTQLPPIDASWQGQQVEILAAVTLKPTGVGDVVPVSVKKGNP